MNARPDSVMATRISFAVAGREVLSSNGLNSHSIKITAATTITMPITIVVKKKCRIFLNTVEREIID